MIGAKCQTYSGTDCLDTDRPNYDSDEDWRRQIVYSSNASHGQVSGDIPEAPETWRLDGDFYREDEDAHRSLSKQQQQQPEHNIDIFLGNGHFGARTVPKTLSSKFAEPVARELSTLWPFTVAITHIKLQHTSPAQAWQKCLRALQQQSRVSIQKLSPHKYTAKANFCTTSGLQCEFKVSIFSVAAEAEDTQADSREGAVLEFQRRNGDCLAFSRLFRGMRRLLNGVGGNAAHEMEMIDLNVLAGVSIS